jgi:hypothetical protein
MNRRKFISKAGILAASASTGAALIPSIIGSLSEGKIEKTLSSSSNKGWDRQINDMVIKDGDKSYWTDYEQFKFQQEWYAQKERELGLNYRSPLYEI